MEIVKILIYRRVFTITFPYISSLSFIMFSLVGMYKVYEHYCQKNSRQETMFTTSDFANIYRPSRHQSLATTCR